MNCLIILLDKLQNYVTHVVVKLGGAGHPLSHYSCPSPDAEVRNVTYCDCMHGYNNPWIQQSLDVRSVGIGYFSRSGQ